MNPLFLQRIVSGIVAALWTGAGLPESRSLSPVPAASPAEPSVVTAALPLSACALLSAGLSALWRKVCS